MNYYDILGVEEDADSESIKKAYKKLAKQFHPDLNPDNVEAAEEKFKKINEAYHVSTLVSFTASLILFDICD